MAWTYSGDPAASHLDLVRFRIGDTDTTDQQLQDAEINYLLTTLSPLYAAAAAAESLAAKYSRLVDKQIGKLQASFSQRAANYLALAKSLRAEAARKGVVMLVAGISVAETEAQNLDEDYPQPAFREDLMETYNTSPRIEPWTP